MAELRCSFCDKPQSEVARIIAGVSGNICGACIALTASILELPPTGPELLVRFPDGSVVTCLQQTAWRPFTVATEGVELEWCVGSTAVEPTRPDQRVVALRRRAPARPIVGATLAPDDEVGDAVLRDVLNAFGGPSALGDSGMGRRRAPRRRESEIWPWSLVAKGFIDDEAIASFLSQQHRIPTIDLDKFNVSRANIELVPVELCVKHVVLPVSRAGSSLIVAMADPTNESALADLRTKTGYEVEPVIASDASIRAAIDKYYRRAPDSQG